MSSARIIGGLAMFAGGYAIAYYGANILMWAHSADEPANDPIPLSHLFGFPSEAVGDPGEFMPPFHLGEEIPGSITDARGLLGGTATTGGYNPPEWTAQNPAGYDEIGPSSGTGGTGTGVPPVAGSLETPGSSNPTGNFTRDANGQYTNTDALGNSYKSNYPPGYASSPYTSVDEYLKSVGQ